MTDRSSGRGAPVVVRPRGELDLAVVDDLERLLGGVPCETPLIVDLSAATFVDSVTLSLFVRTARCHGQHGSTLVLAAPAPIVRRVLTTTRLDDVVPCVDSLDEAHVVVAWSDSPAP